ncbi:hypothetical protein F383_37866 [Gossypium arboreum]|uniref:Uncharacterized protein n=1 Tax=Gossypium arboreum TaxID=29729 RepID=A0A0B0MGP0_GOSAR|nr:hypothetical protein F383_37866 [Gossypium arboreum]
MRPGLVIPTTLCEL